MTTTSILKTGRASGALLSVAVGLWAFQARCQSNLVKNGGFENGLIGWGWTYNVALFSFSDPEGGDNYVGVYGTLYQDLNTTPGQQYDVRFAMAGNFNLPQTAELDVQWGSLTWNPAGHSIYNLGWVWGDFDVTATSLTTRLTFKNPNVGTQNIPLLDAVQVVAVPEPSSLWLISVGILGALLAAVIRNQGIASNRLPSPGWRTR